MRHTIGTAILLCTTIACSFQYHANQDLREKVQNHRIRRVEILQIPEDVAIPVRSTPDSIQERYHAKLELRASALLEEIAPLDAALARTDCKPSTHDVDVRTAVIFFDENDKKVKGFYYGKGGKFGQTDDMPCELGKGLFNWARSRLPDR